MMWISVIVVLVSFCWSCHALTESLTLRPLEDGKVMAHIEFQMKITQHDIQQGHYDLFPKSLGSLLIHYGIHEFSLKLTAGRWWYDKWGYPQLNTMESAYENSSLPSVTMGPIGAELSTAFHTPSSSSWKGFTHGLAGIFCSTLNDMKFITYPQQGKYNTLYYSTLPRENVCTENLTPFLKLIPCHNHIGMGLVLKGTHLFYGWYHMMKIHAIHTSTGYTLTQSITTVLDPYTINKHQHWNWNIQTLFDASPLLPCPLATSSHIYLHFQPWFLSERIFQMKSSVPLAKYKLKDGSEIHRYSTNSSSSLSFQYTSPFVVPQHYQSQPYLLFQRFNTGSGQQHGTYNMEWYNSHPTESIRIRYQDSLPWFLHVYFHTLRIDMNDQKLNLKQDLHWYRFVPAIYRSAPTEIELEISLPPQSTTRLSFSFDKSFLTTNDYPPDVSRGFDLSAALITILPNNIQLYTESSLIQLPFPDRSMPFNVIAFTSTIIAFFFGSMFNLLYSSPSEILTRGSKRPINRLTNRLFRRCRTHVEE